MSGDDEDEDPLIEWIHRLKNIKVPPAPSITCPICDRTSYNPNDIREGYCGNCHVWTSPPQERSDE